ncbi:MAG: biotin--[acetyl-CoA-carboxylase] ligase [Saprospiraceae bacterium]|nr:biotin--[acetyl-CoA-carboxylase] ligase [Saprospiraceae bacterium]
MANTLFIGKVYQRFATLPSTNDWLKSETAKNKPPEGTVVRADSQSAGRGQFGSRWESEAGANLTLSILLHPTWLAASLQFFLSMAVALGAKEAVEKFGVAVSLKWPNDLYAGGKKTGGILIENTLAGTQIQSSIVGIGLNINQINFSPDLPNPTSLALATGRTFDSDQVESALFEGIERRYLQLKAGHLPDIHRDYEAALFRLGLVSRFEKTDEHLSFEAVIRGVHQQGFLRLEMPDGRQEQFDLKSIRLLV